MSKKRSSLALATSISLIFYFSTQFLHVSCSVFSPDIDFLFNDFRYASNLSLDGSALVLSSGALQLTNNSNNVMGHAFFDGAVQMIQNKSRNMSMAVSFSTSFIFEIVADGSGGGHGLAFVVAPSKVLPGASDADYLGILGPTTNGRSSNHVFAIEFDTVLSIQTFNDTNYNHVGIDINSLVSVMSEPAAYYTDDNKKVAVKLESAQPIQVWIDYDSRVHLLNITIAPAAMQHQPRRPLISTKVDLLPIFIENMYIGFSSATGNLASSHYILAWSFRSNGAAQSIDFSRLPIVPKPPLGASPPRNIISSLRIAAPACVGTLIFMAILIIIVHWLRRKIALSDRLEDWELNHPHRYPYKDLYMATKGFDDSKLIGAGGFGQVYKGALRGAGDDVVAIKRISSIAGQGIREFIAEIVSLGRMRHKNLVELRGWCKRGQDLLLVYEFMPNGSLDAHLFGREMMAQPLTWAQRLHILKGIAFGLVYLHEGWEQVVVHRDVKASNVLLGIGMVARLGDFGLARLYQHGADPATTRVVGTLGYMAPEITASGRATTATDVFAFGALLLEVVCGRRPMEPNSASMGVSLVRWVQDLGLKGVLLQAVDPRLNMSYEEQEVKLVLWLGLMCSQDNPDTRPNMRQVCRYLSGELYVEEDLELSFSTTNTVEFLSPLVASMTWSSCGTMSVTSLQGGR